MGPIVDLRFPEWVAIDDDGEDVLIVEVARAPTGPFLVRDRDTFLSALDKLGARASGEAVARTELETRIVEDLRRRGLLVDASAPWPVDLVGVASGDPFLGQLTVELEPGTGSEATLEQLRALFRRMIESGRAVNGVVLRAGSEDRAPAWEQDEPFLVGVLAAIRELYARAERPAPSPICEFPVEPSGASELACGVLDRLGRARAVLRAPKAPREEDAALARHVADQGFDTILEIDPIASSEPWTAVDSWLREARCSGIRLLPRFTHPPLAAIGRDDLRGRVDRALEWISGLTERLGVATQRSQPWRSVLTAAVVPWASTVSWSKKQSRAHLAGDGLWARSRLHRQHGFHGSLEGLFPQAGALPVSRWRDSRLSAETEFPGRPDCEACGFAPLCDRYWSHELDVLLLAGRADLAREVARYECESRMRILGELLDSLRAKARDEANAEGYSKRTLARFQPTTRSLALETE